MTETRALFERAVEAVQLLPERPDNDTLLRLYAYYKQATEGDASGPQPGFFDYVGHAKREAWERLEDMSEGDAMQAYVDLVRELGADV
jgi:acyl-CoA-binding protein